jgi:ParB-like chromosome segregation protein Spo0J
MDQIAPDPANARLHPEANLDAIRGSLLAFGQQKPIVIDRRGVVLAGNGLYQAARQLGWRRIAALRTDLRGPDRAGFAIADNRTAELAEWDEQALARQLAELQETLDLGALGFGPEELARLLGPCGNEGLTDPDAVPEPPDEAITKRGDLWALGDHRLLCGDAGSTQDVKRLLGGATVHLVNADPPYNVKVEPRSNNAIAAGLSSFDRREDLQCRRSTTERGAKDRARLAKRKLLNKTCRVGDARGGLMHHQSFDVARQGLKAATTGKLRPKDRPLVNDFMSDAEFERMLRAWFGQIARVLPPGRCFYIWGGYANCGNYPPVLKACGLYFSQAVI